MILKRENVERVTDDKKEIEELKALGYVEVKNVSRTARKNTGKTQKSNSK